VGTKCPRRSLLKQALRETDFIARYGGEEFVVLLTQTPAAQVADVAEKLRVAVEKAEFNNGDARIPITLSIGYSSFRARRCGAVSRQSWGPEPGLW
jgi:diguanylate cyclase